MRNAGWRRRSPGPMPERVRAWSLPSVRALAGQHGGNGAHQNLQVEPQRAALDVLEVEAHPLLESNAGAAADLPQAGEPGRGGEAAELPGLVLRHFAWNRRARPDQAHLAAQHVDE